MKAYVAFGSNVGRRRALIEAAIARLRRANGVSLRAVSPIYRTSAVGGPPQRDYLNGVAELSTALSARQLLDLMLRTERSLGRVRREKWGPRTIDLDLLVYGNARIKTTNLTVPHPRYHERRFVLEPFCDLAPGLKHPILHRSNRDLLRKLTVPGQRVTIAAQWNGTRFTPSKPKRRQKSRS